MKDEFKTITKVDLETWIGIDMFRNKTLDLLNKILNGEYSLDQARKDILSLRMKAENENN